MGAANVLVSMGADGAILVDEYGNEAHTRAYFLDEILDEKLIEKKAEDIINKHIIAFKELAK